MTDFQLEPDRGLVSPSELATLVAREEARRTGQRPDAVTPATDQTIRNYARRGVVTPAETTPGGRMLFDPAVAVDAVLANRPERRHGGRRRGSGRKKDRPRPAPAFRVAADAAAALEEIRDRADKGVRPRNALPPEFLLNLTPDEARAILAHADAVGVTTACLDRLETVLKVQALERKQAVEAGKLIDADDALRAWTEKQRAVRAEIDRLPGRAADRVAQAAWVSPEAADRLIKAMADAGCGHELLEAARATMAPPPELIARVRALIADEVRGACGRIAGGGEGETERRRDGVTEGG